MEVRQRTLRRPVRLDGIGLHSGAPSSVTCVPAAEGTGIVFVRADLPGSPRLAARLDQVSDLRRGVTLGSGPRVRTVEHLLAAAAGLGLTNMVVEVTGEELPALDGSAAEYVQALRAAGIVEQARPAPARGLSAPVWIARPPAWLLAVPAEALRITYIVPVRAAAIGTLVCDFQAGREDFASAIAPARTWGDPDELDALRREGLARGASAENVLGIGPDGYLSPPRFADEPARHKVLDLIGDLALLGASLRAHVVVCAGGHALHVALARQLAQAA